jgi:hypothetical protein
MFVRSPWPHELCFTRRMSQFSNLSSIYMNQIFMKGHSTIAQGPHNVNALIPTAQNLCQVPYFLSPCRANILFPFIELYCSPSPNVPKDKSRDLFPRFSFTLLHFFILSYYCFWPHLLHWPSPFDEWKQYAIVHNVAQSHGLCPQTSGDSAYSTTLYATVPT